MKGNLYTHKISHIFCQQWENNASCNIMYSNSNLAMCLGFWMLWDESNLGSLAPWGYSTNLGRGILGIYVFLKQKKLASGMQNSNPFGYFSRNVGLGIPSFSIKEHGEPKKLRSTTYQKHASPCTSWILKGVFWKGTSNRLGLSSISLSKLPSSRSKIRCYFGPFDPAGSASNGVQVICCWESLGALHHGQRWVEVPQQTCNTSQGTCTMYSAAWRDMAGFSHFDGPAWYLHDFASISIRCSGGKLALEPRIARVFHELCRPGCWLLRHMYHCCC